MQRGLALGQPLMAHQHGEDGLVRVCLGGLGDGHRHVLLPHAERRDEDRHDGIEVRVFEQGAEGRAVPGRRGAGDHVQRVAQRRLGGKEGAQLLHGLGGQLRHLQALGLQRVGAQDAGAAGVRHHGGAPAPRGGLPAEGHRKIEQLLHRTGTQDTGLLQHGGHGHVAGRQRSGVTGGGAGAGLGGARFHHDDRLPPGDARGDLEKLAGIAEALHVHQDHLDLRIVLPLQQDVVAADIRLVAHRDELADPDAVFLGVVQHAQSHRSRLAHEPDAAVGRQGRGEGGVEPEIGVPVQDAHAIRADHPDSGRPDVFGQLPLQGHPVSADFAEPGGDDHEPADAPLHTIAGDRHDLALGHHNDGEIGCLREVRDAGEGGDGADGPGIGVHRVDRAGVAVAHQGGDDLVADGAWGA